MGDLSAHFSLSEWACHCCGKVHVEMETVQCLEDLRHLAGDAPMTIVSGYRCLKHNRACGSSDKSRHLVGMAADIQIHGLRPIEVFRLAESMPRFRDSGGLGLYATFLHLDVRPLRARWGQVNGEMVTIEQARQAYA